MMMEMDPETVSKYLFGEDDEDLCSEGYVQCNYGRDYPEIKGEVGKSELQGFLRKMKSRDTVNPSSVTKAARLMCWYIEHGIYTGKRINPNDRRKMVSASFRDEITNYMHALNDAIACVVQVYKLFPYSEHLADMLARYVEVESITEELEKRGDHHGRILLNMLEILPGTDAPCLQCMFERKDALKLCFCKAKNVKKKHAAHVMEMMKGVPQDVRNKDGVVGDAIDQLLHRTGVRPPNFKLDGLEEILNALFTMGDLTGGRDFSLQVEIEDKCDMTTLSQKSIPPLPIDQGLNSAQIKEFLFCNDDAADIFELSTYVMDHRALKVAPDITVVDDYSVYTLKQTECWSSPELTRSKARASSAMVSSVLQSIGPCAPSTEEPLSLASVSAPDQTSHKAQPSQQQQSTNIADNSSTVENCLVDVTPAVTNPQTLQIDCAAAIEDIIKIDSDADNTSDSALPPTNQNCIATDAGEKEAVSYHEVTLMDVDKYFDPEAVDNMLRGSDSYFDASSHIKVAEKVSPHTSSSQALASSTIHVSGGSTHQTKVWHPIFSSATPTHEEAVPVPEQYDTSATNKSSTLKLGDMPLLDTMPPRSSPAPVSTPKKADVAPPTPTPGTTNNTQTDHTVQKVATTQNAETNESSVTTLNPISIMDLTTSPDSPQPQKSIKPTGKVAPTSKRVRTNRTDNLRPVPLRSAEANTATQPQPRVIVEPIDPDPGMCTAVARLNMLSTTAHTAHRPLSVPTRHSIESVLGPALSQGAAQGGGGSSATSQSTVATISSLHQSSGKAAAVKLPPAAQTTNRDNHVFTNDIPAATSASTESVPVAAPPAPVSMAAPVPVATHDTVAVSDTFVASAAVTTPVSAAAPATSPPPPVVSTTVDDNDPITYIDLSDEMDDSILKKLQKHGILETNPDESKPSTSSRKASTPSPTLQIMAPITMKTEQQSYQQSDGVDGNDKATGGNTKGGENDCESVTPDQGELIDAMETTFSNIERLPVKCTRENWLVRRPPVHQGSCQIEHPLCSTKTKAKSESGRIEGLNPISKQAKLSTPSAPPNAKDFNAIFDQLKKSTPAVKSVNQPTVRNKNSDSSDDDDTATPSERRTNEQESTSKRTQLPSSSDVYNSFQQAMPQSPLTPSASSQFGALLANQFSKLPFAAGSGGLNVRQPVQINNMSQAVQPGAAYNYRDAVQPMQWNDTQQQPHRQPPTEFFSSLRHQQSYSSRQPIVYGESNHLRSAALAADTSNNSSQQSFDSRDDNNANSGEEFQDGVDSNVNMSYNAQYKTTSAVQGLHSVFGSTVSSFLVTEKTFHMQAQNHIPFAQQSNSFEQPNQYSQQAQPQSSSYMSGPPRQQRQKNKPKKRVSELAQLHQDNNDRYPEGALYQARRGCSVTTVNYSNQFCQCDIPTVTGPNKHFCCRCGHDVVPSTPTAMDTLQMASQGLLDLGRSTGTLAATEATPNEEENSFEKNRQFYDGVYHRAGRSTKGNLPSFRR